MHVLFTKAGNGACTLKEGQGEEEKEDKRRRNLYCLSIVPKPQKKRKDIVVRMHNLVHAITHLIFMRVLKMRERKRKKET